MKNFYGICSLFQVEEMVVCLAFVLISTVMTDTHYAPLQIRSKMFMRFYIYIHLLQETSTLLSGLFENND